MVFAQAAFQEQLAVLVPAMALAQALEESVGLVMELGVFQATLRVERVLTLGCQLMAGSRGPS